MHFLFQNGSNRARFVRRLKVDYKIIFIKLQWIQGNNSEWKPSFKKTEKHHSFKTHYSNVFLEGNKLNGMSDLPL